MSVTKDEQKRPRTFAQKVALFLPLIIFGSLATFFLLQLTSGRNAQDLPSVLIGKQAPSLSMQALEGSGLPALNDASISGKLTLVNVWASWCVPCRQEHPFLLELSKDKRVQIVGLNYKDKNENALKFLNELGNPYTAIGVDPNGAAAIDWGVYGVPETFLISPSGIILYKHIGPIDARGFEEKILPAIEATQ
ncbi:DsbE family thiol:disulfide interchange protein [Lentilitoribacter sp. Alg239-R112]|uniref:DsbE family thiol:disulfide interchange protein n=1 Tax=Lentilitoribacter sp. Alg239-R112 TaxID=2305987 RepID=UPI0013A6EFA2|nr:DsbE family thiol:disulfide interchange protein [Lentilitoribacter sp. Alg239-R112]